MNKFEKKIAFYIRSFDTEQLLYEQGHTWAKKGWLSRDEFISICLWKSRRPKQLYNKNSTSRIKSITRKAFNESDEKQRMTLLVSLSGVSVPTASAILSVTDPKNYPVIDIRCVESLQELKLVKWNAITVTSWLKYLDIVRRISKRNNKTARQVEKGLFSFNRLKLDKEFTNLYDRSRK